MWVQFLGREDPLKEGIIPIPIFGLPWWLRLQCGRPGFDPWARKIPWRRKWQPTPVLLPGKFHGQRSLVGYSPWGRKESDTTEQLHFTSSLHTTQTPVGHFFKRADRNETSKEPRTCALKSGVSETAAYPPSPIADDPSALPSSHLLSLLQSVTLLFCSLDASPCMPAITLYCYTFQGTVL